MVYIYFTNQINNYNWETHTMRTFFGYFFDHETQYWLYTDKILVFRCFLICTTSLTNTFFVVFLILSQIPLYFFSAIGHIWSKVICTYPLILGSLTHNGSTFLSFLWPMKYLKPFFSTYIFFIFCLSKLIRY